MLPHYCQPKLPTASLHTVREARTLVIMHGLVFSSKQYVTMTTLKPSHVNVELVVNKIIACLNGIWGIMENY